MYRHIIKNMPSIPEIAGGSYRDNFMLCDMPGLAQAASEARGHSLGGGGAWAGNMDYAESMRCVREGDLAGVAPSETFLSELEGMSFVSRKYRVLDDVVGSFPNVPNMLAGVPCAMRRRVRTTNVTAPLAVFADLTSSGGVSAKDLHKRGAAILALVRLLSNLRPVELWGIVGVGDARTAYYVACRVETAPLDLARVAHVLTHPSVPRSLMYSIAGNMGWSSGHWPYQQYDAAKRHGAAIVSRVISPGSDVLFIPPVYLLDDSIQQPVKWITEQLKQYGGQTVEAA